MTEQEICRAIEMSRNIITGEITIRILKLTEETILKKDFQKGECDNGKSI